MRHWTTAKRALAALGLALAAGAASAAIPIEHWVHPSGTRVYLVNSPTIPMVDVQMDFDGGSRREPARQAGLANAAAGLLDGGVGAYEGQPARDETDARATAREGARDRSPHACRRAGHDDDLAGPGCARGHRGQASKLRAHARGS